MTCQLKFEKINFSVTKTEKKCCQKGTPQTKKILQNVSGVVEPGEMLAIIGPSGSGKTSLVNILAGRLPKRKWGGEILINDTVATRKVMKKYTGYVPQEDVLLGSQTVEEALRFYADLGLPTTFTKEEKRERVEQVMVDLGLTKVRDNLIGYSGEDESTSAIKRGISGGERKRLGIGLQLISDPAILFLDEPTTGLDSYIAETVIEKLASLAAKGKTIILTVHQPSTEILQHFDKLMIIAHGQTVYFGKEKQTLRYFEKHGYECPQDENPADYYIKVLHLGDEGEMGGFENTQKRAKILGKDFRKSRAYKNTTKADVQEPLDMGYDEEPLPNFGTQFYHLAIREWQIVTRDPAAFLISLSTNIFVGILIGFIYFQIGNDQKSIQDRGGVVFFLLINAFFGGLLDPFRNVLVESRVFYFQNQEGLYTVGPYFLSRILLKMPLNFFSNLVFVTITYLLIGLQYEVSKFFIFYLCVVVLAWSSLGLGYVLMVSLPPQIAQTLYPIIFIPMMIFSGFYSNSSRVPIYLSWIEVLSFIKYAYRAAAQNEFTGLELVCQEDEIIPPNICPYNTGEQYLDFRSLDVVPIYYDIITLASIGTGLLVIAFMILSNKVSKTKNG